MALIDVRPVDRSSTAMFVEYAARYGSEHDDSYTGPDDLGAFDPAGEPAILAYSPAGEVVGAASVMLDGYVTRGTGRIRILHTASPHAYPVLLRSLLARVPSPVERVFLFLPDPTPPDLVGALEAEGFAVSRRANLLVHDDLARVRPLPVPAGLRLVPALSEHAREWAAAVNVIFVGQPGHYDLSTARAESLLSRDRVLRPATLMAVREDRLVGLVLSVRDTDDPTVVEVETLGVQPEHRRQGIGRALLTAALSTSVELGLATAVLSTGVLNREALTLYIRNGFRLDDVRVCWQAELRKAVRTLRGRAPRQ